MVDLLELGLIALAALAGSGFMWLLMLLGGLPWLVPRVVEKSAARLLELTDAEIAEAGGVLKAATKKQTTMFAHGLEGAIGKIIQTAPDTQLDALAKQYGFPDAKTAAAQLTGSAGGGHLPSDGGIPGGALQALQSLGGSKSGGFSRIVELVSALQALSGAAGGGAGLGLGGGNVSSGGW